MSFCGLTKGISPKICILCVRVIISKRSFEPFCVWILFRTLEVILFQILACSDCEYIFLVCSDCKRLFCVCMFRLWTHFFYGMLRLWTHFSCTFRLWRPFVVGGIFRLWKPFFWYVQTVHAFLLYVPTVNAFFLVCSDCERLFSCMFRLWTHFFVCFLFCFVCSNCECLFLVCLDCERIFSVLCSDC